MIYCVEGFNELVDIILPCLITFTSVSFFITFTNRPLLPSYIALAISYYMQLSFAICLKFIHGVKAFIGSRVSLRRIEAFLSKTEIDKKNDLEKTDEEMTRVFVKIENLLF